MSFSATAAIHFERATVFADDGLHGRVSAEPTPTSIAARSLLYNGAYEQLYTLVCVCHLLLAQWESPVSPRGSAADVACWAADGIILAFIAADLLVLQTRYYGWEGLRTRGWLRAKAIILGLLVLNFVVHLWTPAVPYVARVLRPIFLVERKATVRKIAVNMVKATPQIAFVAMLVCLHTIVFAVTFFILFAGIDGKPEINGCTVFRAPLEERCSVFLPTGSGCRAYFANLEESIIHTFAMVTGAEFPGAMLPVMGCSKYFSLIFLAAFVSGNYLLLNLALAVTNEAFKRQLLEEVLRRYERMFAGFDLAFRALIDAEDAHSPIAAAEHAALALIGSNSSSSGGVGGGSLTQSKDSRAKGVSRASFLRFMERYQPRMSPIVCGKFFDVMEATRVAEGRPCSGVIDAVDFRRLLFNFGALRVMRVRRKRSSSRAKSQREGGQLTVVAVGGVAEDDAAHRVSQQREFSSAVSEAGTELEGDEQEDADRDEDLEIFFGTDFASPPSFDADAPDSPVAEMDGDGNSGFEPGAPPSEAWGVAAKTDAVRVNPLAMIASAPAAAVPDWEASRGKVGVVSPQASSSLLSPSARSPHTSDDSPSKGGEEHHQPAPLVARTSTFLKAYFDADVQGAEARRSVNLRHGVPRDIPRKSCRGRALAFMHKLPVMIILELLGIVNVAAVLAQLAIETEETQKGNQYYETVNILRYINYATFAVFAIEVWVAAVLMGPRRFWRSSVWHRVDVAVFTVALAGTIIDNTVGDSSGSSSIEDNSAADLLTVALFCRLAKVLRALRLIPGLSVTVLAFVDMLPALARYIAVLLSIFYVFALTGIMAFSGLLQRGNPLVDATAYGQSGFYPLNFDDLYGAYLALIQQLNVVQWPVLMEALVASTGSTWVRFYFVFFWFIGVFVVLNVIIAFMVESFSVEKRNRERLEAIEQAVEAELDAHDGEHDDHGHGHGHGKKGGHKARVLARKNKSLSEWRSIIVKSGVDFTGWRISRRYHHLDIYDQIYFEDIVNAHSDTMREAAAATVAPVGEGHSGAPPHTPQKHHHHK